jgi:predicted ATPase/DNA-binding SARP family transcriptional activator
MRFGILGPLEVVDDEGRLLGISAHKLSAVLAIMLLHRGEPVAVERLADELWGDAAPASSGKTVRVYIARLRKLLGVDLVQTRGHGYVLATAPGAVDVDVFEHLASEGRAALASGDQLAAGQRLRQALELCRGTPLADFIYEPFAQAEIARLEEARMTVLEDRIDADLACGRHNQLGAELAALIREQPRRERLRAQLMLALYRSGRQADALESYRSARHELVDELGIEPSRTLQELHQAMLRHDPRLELASELTAPSPGPAVSRRLTNLPRRARQLVGRDEERQDLCELLVGGADLVISLTGIGGSGKTLLAMAVGSEMLDWASGGVFLVRLAATRDPDSILPMIAEAVEITGESEGSLPTAIARRLGQQPTLLILDNFEHLAPAARLVIDLAAQAPQLRILVTSQVPMRVSHERVFALGPLARDDAIALFLDRARARDRTFEPTADGLASIDRICALLDCMPLAIELAAARVGALTPGDLERRLERPLGVLTRGAADAPERQRSLRSAIDWTHTLLGPGSRELFGRFGVCAGPVPLTTVEAIADGGKDPAGTLDLLEELIEFSFVRRQEDRRLGIRFQVPQALRDFALERLRAVGQEDHVRRLHARHIAELAHAARLWKWGATSQQRLGLVAVLDEIRFAVAWARDHDPELHVRICAALAAYWVYGGVLSEVAEELRRARESGMGSPADRATILALLAKCVQLEGAGSYACELAEQALAELRVVDDEQERALWLPYVGWVFTWARRYDEAVALAEESLAIVRHSGDRKLILRSLVFLAHTLADKEDITRTEAVLDEADELAQGDPVWELDAIHADCASLRGRYREALRLYTASLTWTSTTSESHQILMDIRCIAKSLTDLDRLEEALEVAELVALEERRTGRSARHPSLIGWFDHALSAAKQRAGTGVASDAAKRASQVPPTERAIRTIEVATAVLTSDDARRS